MIACFLCSNPQHGSLHPGFFGGFSFVEADRLHGDIVLEKRSSLIHEETGSMNSKNSIESNEASTDPCWIHCSSFRILHSAAPYRHLACLLIISKECSHPTNLFGWDSFVHEGKKKFPSPHVVKCFAGVEVGHYKFSRFSYLERIVDGVRGSNDEISTAYLLFPPHWLLLKSPRVLIRCTSKMAIIRSITFARQRVWLIDLYEANEAVSFPVLSGGLSLHLSSPAELLRCSRIHCRVPGGAVRVLSEGFDESWRYFVWSRRSRTPHVGNGTLVGNGSASGFSSQSVSECLA